MGKKIQKQVNTPDLTDRIFDLFDSIAMKDYREIFKNAILLAGELDKKNKEVNKKSYPIKKSSIIDAEIITNQVDFIKSDKAKRIN